MKEKVIEIHEDWTGSKLSVWNANRSPMIVCSDQSGYTAVHLTKEEWQIARAKINDFYFPSCEKNPKPEEVK